MKSKSNSLNFYQQTDKKKENTHAYDMNMAVEQNTVK